MLKTAFFLASFALLAGTTSHTGDRGGSSDAQTASGTLSGAVEGTIAGATLVALTNVESGIAWELAIEANASTSDIVVTSPSNASTVDLEVAISLVDVPTAPATTADGNAEIGTDVARELARRINQPLGSRSATPRDGGRAPY